MDTDKTEEMNCEVGMLRRTIVVLFIFTAATFICLTAVSHVASVRLRVEYLASVDPPLPGGPILCDLRAANGWLHLDYTRTSKCESPGPMSAPGHWWGGWSWIQTETGQNLRVLLPAWALIILLLAYPVYTLARLAMAKPRRGSLTPATPGGPGPGARARHQPGSLRLTVLTITLFLFVLMLSLSLASLLFCPVLSVSARDANSPSLKLSLERGWWELDVTRGPPEAFFSVAIPTPYNRYGWTDAVQVGNATRYRARIASWEPIAVLAIYPSVVFSGMALR